MKSEAVWLRIATSALLERAKVPGDPESHQTNLLCDPQSDLSEQQQPGQIVASHRDVSDMGGGHAASPPHPGKTQGFTAAPDQADPTALPSLVDKTAQDTLSAINRRHPPL